MKKTMAAAKRTIGNGRKPRSSARSAATREVPMQIMVPEAVRRQVALLCARRGENIRTMVLRGLRSVGIQISESELIDRRGRRRKD
jgi:trimethylamine:corrinoid methyltransferase-like protein